MLIAGGLLWLLLGGELDTVQSAIASTGAWGPVVYVALHVLLTLVPVSKNLLSGVAGALFGLAGGIAISWVASMLSALVGIRHRPPAGPRRRRRADRPTPGEGRGRSCATRGSRRWSWRG